MTQILSSQPSALYGQAFAADSPRMEVQSFPLKPVRLTTVERDFRHLAIAGATDLQIASRLFLSIETVAKYRRKLPPLQIGIREAVERMGIVAVQGARGDV